ncbi:hypothetical protein ABZ904_09920 [Streptomyces sp. NPDC046900]|uniref:P-loop ATPase, Sll1717 family n=1 Tax=Streptomyces sp. NPDC046900 TaxID=3155473 RepID=UPI0033C16342
MGEPAESAPVKRLYFGHEDAERDIASGLLRAGFVRTTAYDAALSGRKMLILGRKGSGKSALCMQLAAGGHPGGTVLITPDDAAGDEIRRFELQGVTGDTAKSLIWRYVFAVQAARHLVEHARVHGRRQPRAVRRLRKFLHANGESLQDRLYDRLATGARGLQTSLSLEVFGVKAGLDVAGSTTEGARATRQLEVVEQGVADAFDALGCVDSHGRLLLLVDQLEQVWSSDPDSHAMVIGLLLAAKHIAARYGDWMRCLLFLRSDIYDMLAFGEGDKFHGDELRIHWTLEDLSGLALARARASAGPELTRDQLWGGIFPHTVDGRDTVERLLGTCLPRPRDVIQYLNLCRDTAVEHDHQVVTEADINEATRQFSQWKLQDLANEYLVAHPYLGRLPLLFDNAGYVATRSAIEERFAAYAPTLHSTFPAYTEALTPSAVIDTLFAVNFLGVRRGGDVVYVSSGKLPVQPHETEFHIHPCFRPALGCTQPTALRSFHPGLLSPDGSPPPSWGSPQSGHRSAGSAAGPPVGRDFALLDRLSRSCGSVQAAVGRATRLPDDTRAQVLWQLTRMMGHAQDGLLRLRSGRPVDTGVLLLDAARYFTLLAGQLRASHVEDDGRDSVAWKLDDEAERLVRAVGGSTGGSGDFHS